MPAPAHLGGTEHMGPSENQYRPGVAGATGFQPVQLLHRLHCKFLGQHRRVRLQHRGQLLPPVLLHHQPAQPGGQLRKLLLPHGEAGGQGMAPKALQQIAAPGQKLEQVDPAPGAA